MKFFGLILVFCILGVEISGEESSISGEESSRSSNETVKGSRNSVTPTDFWQNTTDELDDEDELDERAPKSSAFRTSGEANQMFATSAANFASNVQNFTSGAEHLILTDVFIAIVSAQGREALRKAMRETWVAELGELKVPYRFFIGGNTIPLDTKHGDIVQLKVDDTFDGLAEKSLAIFDWVVKNVQTDFVFKVNDNVMVSPHRTLPRIRLLDSFGIYHGCRYADDKPVRTKGDKFELKEANYPWNYILPYVEVWKLRTMFILTIFAGDRLRSLF